MGQRSKTCRVHGEMLQIIRRLSINVLKCRRLATKSVGYASLRRFAFLAYLSSVFVRSSIGGYVKSVRVDEVSASGDVGFCRCGGSCSSSVSSLKNVSEVGG